MINLFVILGTFGIFQILLILLILFLLFGVKRIPNIYYEIKRQINEILDEKNKDKKD